MDEALISTRTGVHSTNIDLNYSVRVISQGYDVKGKDSAPVPQCANKDNDERPLQSS